MKTLCAAIGVAMVMNLALAAQNYPPPPTVDELTDYVLSHQVSPEDYVIQKFRDHDVVVLGEHHRIKHDLELIQRLIPRCYDNGIRVLAYEFADRRSQALIDSLLSLPEYDEGLARQIAFAAMPEWAYQEYLDIYKSAWAVNHSLPAGTAKFRIVAMNCSGDWSYIKTKEDQQNDSLRRLVWAGCPGLEREWAMVILRQVRQGEKVLAYCGMHHAFTRYFQPATKGAGEFSNFVEDQRMARYLFYRLGPRVFSISLHYPWEAADRESGFVKPVNGVIDAVMDRLADHFRPVGFDVVAAPFGMLTDNAAIYQVGYPDFRLRDFCDGYIVSRPFRDYETVQFVEDFINAANIGEFRRHALNPGYRDIGIQQARKSLRSQLQREQEIYRALE